MVTSPLPARPRLRREAQPLAEADHAMVLAQDVADHALDAALAGIVQHVAQQQLAIAAALAIRRDDQRELGLLEARIGGEPADAQQLFTVEQQEGHLAVVVDLRQPRRHLVASARAAAEEAQPRCPPASARR